MYDYEETLNTFDEGVILGGVRSKNEIRTLICYLYASVKTPMDKETVVEIIQAKGLANYFETSACFDDLIAHNNLAPTDENKKLYDITDNGRMVSEQLESTLANSVKEKAYTCALALLEKRRIEKENAVTISKTDKGYNVNCRISGGDVDLISIDIYAPDNKQAKVIKKNFHNNPELLYKVIMGTMTKDKSMVQECLKTISSDSRRRD